MLDCSCDLGVRDELYVTMRCVLCRICFFFQAEDGIRDLVRSRGLGDVYKRQYLETISEGHTGLFFDEASPEAIRDTVLRFEQDGVCLLYTSDAADERSSVDLGGRRIITKKKKTHLHSA